MNDAHDIAHLRRTVSIHKHPTIPSYVRLADIPQPWRDRFLETLVGSQMPVVAGEGKVAYEADWILFLGRTQRRLAARRIAEVLKDVKTGPSPELLEAAPLLDTWFVVRDASGELSLHGAVSDHPDLPGQGRWIVTSILIGLDPAAGHARTVSRWYRLGRLIDADACEALRGKPLNPALTPVALDEVPSWFAGLRAFAAREDFDV